MVTAILQQLFARDLARLHHEIKLYKDENAIWKTAGQVSNSAGNLCLHLIGNLNTYIGKELGKTGYVRNREEEFSLKNIPREQLLSRIEATMRIVDDVLEKLDDAVLNEEYPMPVFEEKTSTGYLLIHLSTHLGYHLGQVNYHRRMTDAM